MTTPSGGAPLRGADLLTRMQTLLENLRPPLRAGEPQREIPLLTEALADSEGQDTLPMPQGISREVLQAHLAAAAEKVMHALYRDLSTDLNEKFAEEMRRVMDQAIARAVKNLRQQVLVRVAESLTQSIDQSGRQYEARNEEPPSSFLP